MTAHGDPNTDVTAVLNLPLIADTMAVRAVIYNDARGGYIDNVPATFTRKNTDIGIHYANYPAVNGQCPDGQPNGGFCVPPGSPSINNNSVAARAINPVTYQGIRVEALYKFNDDWDVLITQSYQDLNSQGVFYQQPNASDGAPLKPLEVTLFNNASDKDKFESTAWTVNGKVRRFEGRLYRRLPRAQCPTGRRLHELRARRVCRLLSVLRPGYGWRPRPQVDLLLAERRLALGSSATRTSNTNSA